MLIVRRKVDTRAATELTVTLAFERRQQTRFQAMTDSGEEIGFLLERGTALRDGEVLQADDGRLVRVVAAAEPLLEVESADALQLARAAYHLGNRHAMVEIGARWLRCPADGVLEQLVRRMGFPVRTLCAPFQPEPGAYSGGHAHAASAHRGIIHDYTRGSPDHDG